MAKTSDFSGSDTAAGHVTSDGQSIRLENVKKTFADGSVVACEDIDLDISPDEFVVLLGPSGCGKTTTLRCISGLETPDEGTIKIGDRDVTDAKPKDRDLAFVFQSIALFPRLSVQKTCSSAWTGRRSWTKRRRNGACARPRRRWVSWRCSTASPPRSPAASNSESASAARW